MTVTGASAGGVNIVRFVGDAGRGLMNSQGIILGKSLIVHINLRDKAEITSPFVPAAHSY